jgi:FMN phosphatase YigB (HAD superfamily)
MKHYDICFDDVNPLDFGGICIDLDDTLYRYAPCHNMAIRACFEHYDFNLTFDAFRLNYREARNTVTQALAPQASCRSRLFAFQKMAEESAFPVAYELAYTLDKIYWAEFIDTMVLAPSALNFLMRCEQQAVPICMVTDMTAHVQICKIKRLGIAPFITYLVTSDEVGAEKPDFRMFEKAAGKLGIDIKRCLMLGDNLQKDVLGARAAGMSAYKIILTEERRENV